MQSKLLLESLYKSIIKDVMMESPGEKHHRVCLNPALSIKWLDDWIVMKLY